MTRESGRAALAPPSVELRSTRRLRMDARRSAPSLPLFPDVLPLFPRMFHRVWRELIGSGNHSPRVVSGGPAQKCRFLAMAGNCDPHELLSVSSVVSTAVGHGQGRRLPPTVLFAVETGLSAWVRRSRLSMFSHMRAMRRYRTPQRPKPTRPRARRPTSPRM